MPIAQDMKSFTDLYHITANNENEARKKIEKFLEDEKNKGKINYYEIISVEEKGESIILNGRAYDFEIGVSGTRKPPSERVTTYPGSYGW